jgi:predicted esterase
MLRFAPTLLFALGLVTQLGCAVPQPPGHGRCSRLVEPSTHTGYWLYLPEDYVKNHGRNPNRDRWPLVMTFHGLRPYDDANPQIREWQVEADRYNFIVVAPELRTCDTLVMVPPLRSPDFWALKLDEQATLAIMDEVTRRTDADPSRVLATSFSSGGYIAHYMVNRHPERFSCLVVRGSNFHEDLMDASQVSKYRNMKVGVYFGENDIKLCADESMRAVEWYRMHRFSVTAKKVGGLGHERRPEIAAAFFASSIGVTPKTPPDLARLVMKDITPEGGESRFTTRNGPSFTPNFDAPRTDKDRSSTIFSPSASDATLPTAKPSTPPRPALQPMPQPAPTVQNTPAPTQITPRRTEPPKRPVIQNEPEVGKTAPRSPQRARQPLVFSHREKVEAEPLPANIRVHGEVIGQSPFQVGLSVAMPDDLRVGATILWTDNDRPMRALNGFEAQAVLKEPGQHHIAAHVITSDDRKLVLRQTITVMNAASQPSL